MEKTWEELKNLMNELLADCKVNKKVLVSLKNTAVKSQKFELASGLREMETTLFPLTEEQKKAKESAEMIRLILQMVELNVSEDVCWLLFETFKKYQKIKGKFSVRDAAELISKRKQLFDTESDK